MGNLKRQAVAMSRSQFYKNFEHDSPQLYDIVHFEHRLSWICFELLQKASHQWRVYYLIINPQPFHKLIDVGHIHPTPPPRAQYY